MDLDVEFQFARLWSGGNRKGMPVVVDTIDSQESKLTRRKAKENGLFQFENDHSRAIGTRNSGRAGDLGRVLVIQVHSGSITKVKEQRRGEPLEGLTPFLPSSSFHIQCVRNRHKIHNKHGMMNGIEDLVGDGMAKVRRESNQKHERQDAVSGNHNLFCKLFAKCFFSIRAQESEKGKEENHSPEHNDNHSITKMDVHPERAIERQDLVHKRFAKSRDGEPCHGQRNQGHLKQDGMHGSELQRRSNDLPPVTVCRFWNST